MTTLSLESPSAAGRLEELVDRLLSSLFRDEPERETAVPGLVRTVHEARRLRQSGDLDGALSVFTGIDTANAGDSKLRWLYAEWLDIAQRRFAGDRAVLYSPATGRAAALVERDDGSLEVMAVLGMRWQAGKLVSRRSLRGQKPLAKGGP